MINAGTANSPAEVVILPLLGSQKPAGTQRKPAAGEFATKFTAGRLKRFQETPAGQDFEEIAAMDSEVCLDCLSSYIAT